MTTGSGSRQEDRRQRIRIGMMTGPLYKTAVKLSDDRMLFFKEETRIEPVS